MRRLLIGLTGTLGSGKSTALAELARRGAATASADEAARALSGPGGGVSRAVRRILGPSCLRPDGSVDRAATARRVFRDPAARRRLEREAHPRILREVERRLRAQSRLRASRRPLLRRDLRARRWPVAVVDAPLLFEAGLRDRFDLVVAVSAPRGAALARVRRRDRMSRAEANRRMRAQWPAARKEAAADVVWRNGGSKTDFLRRVRDYYRAWDLLARGGSHG